MNPRRDENGEARLDALLDGVLSQGERAAAEKQLRASPEWQEASRLQGAIDNSLRRQFPIAGPPSTEWLSAAASPRPESTHTSLDSRRGWALVMAASVVALLAGAWWWNSGGRQPYFAPQPVAQVYRATIASGFEPYYECNDSERFARVFRTRQAVPLELRPMPEGKRMLGLSYPGGLSRNTTAMLCEVEGEPVIVFVDRLEKDFSQAADNDDPALHVFREERGGLVFYEVSPFASPQVTEYLAVKAK